jgi:hypothetical protein
MTATARLLTDGHLLYPAEQPAQRDIFEPYHIFEP